MDKPVALEKLLEELWRVGVISGQAWGLLRDEIRKRDIYYASIEKKENEMTHGLANTNISYLPVVSKDDFHRTKYGGFWTTHMFWDCACPENYIHPRSQRVCLVCGAHAENQPDSMVNEVVAHGLARSNPNG